MAAIRKLAMKEEFGAIGDRSRFSKQLEDLYLEIASGVSQTRLEATVRQWLSKVDEDDDVAFARSIILAMDLEIFSPSFGGTTAIDRLSRRRRLAAAEAAALVVLKTARLTLLRITSIDDTTGTFAAEQLVNGDRLTVYGPSVPPTALGATIATRLAASADGTFWTVGPLTPLDDAGLQLALSFVRPGKAALNDQRCATAVYRHVVRHGNPQIEGLNFHPDLDAEREDGAVGYEMSPIDAAAKALAALGETSSQSGEVWDGLRTGACTDSVIEAVFKWYATASHANLKAVSSAYRRIATIQMETLKSRADSGVGRQPQPFEAIERAIDDEIALRGYPPGAKALFKELGKQLSPRSAPGRNDDELTKVIDRIRALRAKTLDQGCTESEAVAAAKKVAELLDRYGLTLSAVDIEQQRCEGVGIDTTRKRAGPLDECLQAIAAFCDCRAWQETTAAGTLRSLFFGLPADVEAAGYLYGRIDAAFATETAAFKVGAIYAATENSARRTATNSFQVGLAVGVSNKLRSLKAERDEAFRGATGRDLVPLKAAAIEDDLAKLGLTFTTRSRTGRRVEREAFRAGEVAGRKFEAHDSMR